MTESSQFEFMDVLSILSFCISLKNLDENLSQNDKQELQKDLTDKINLLLQEIHSHLKMQDEKIDMILEEIKHDNR